MTNGDNYDPSKASVKDKVKFFNSFVDANKDAKQKPATPSNNTQQPCPLKEIQLVELVEVVTQDKEKWVKGAAMDATDTKVITESVERAAKDGANFKQYINLDKDLEGQAKRHPEYGRNITLRARVKQKDGKTDQLANVKVNFSFKLTKGPNRSNPAPPDPAPTR